MADTGARMRIPPLYKTRAWQMFFCGSSDWGRTKLDYFLYMYGIYHEEQTSTIAKQQLKIQALEQDKHLLIEDQKAE
ncbi:hypothetical protein GCM10020331_032070 [Ectobacillus funiculus]